MEHKLKTWSEIYVEVWHERKTFDIRFNDRDYKVGDILILEEYYIGSKIYSGSTIHAKVTYILHGGQFGLEKGYVCMGFYILSKVV